MSKQTFLWLVSSLIRLLAGWISVKFAIDASQAEAVITHILDASISMGVAGISLWWSIKNRRDLLESLPSWVPEWLKEYIEAVKAGEVTQSLAKQDKPEQN